MKMIAFVKNLLVKIQHLSFRLIERIKRWSLRKKISLGIVLLLSGWFLVALPAKLFTSPTSFVLTDTNGVLLSAAIASDGQWRFPYNPTVPEKFKQCIMVQEDKRFMYHPGVDPIAMVRAIRQNIGKGGVHSGASTITMQVIRLHKKNNRRTIWNKLQETILAIRLECGYRKKTILAMYASNAPFGSNVVGLDAAAWRYYGRDAQLLSWGEMAALAVLPNAPSLVHPGKNIETLLRKRNQLLDKLASAKIIDQTTADLAKLEPLPGKPKALPQLTPHLLDFYRKKYTSLQKEKDDLPTGIATTIDSKLQQQLIQLAQQYHEQQKGNQINNIAAMVVENNTGNILAYLGNIYRPSEPGLESHVDVLQSPRSPGSTLKPLLYAAMLSGGEIMPTQIIPDIPTQIGGYSPQNFDLGFDGAVPAQLALARSLNIPAVKMLQQYKYQRFYDLLKQAGFQTLNQPADFYGLSLILGGCEVTPFELAGVYSSMARMYQHQQVNQQKWNPKDWFMPNFIDQKILKSHSVTSSSTQALFDCTSMYQMFNAMTEVMRPNEEGLWSQFSAAQKIAWKTGTSFGFRDGWAIGLTPKYCVVVWMGNTNGEGRPGLIGVQTAAPLMFDIFRLLPKSAWFKHPTAAFHYVPVCKKSGFKAGADCAIQDTVMIGEAGLVNGNTCTYCKIIHLDRTGTYRVSTACEEPQYIQHKSWFNLPPTMEYYYKVQNPSYQVLPPYLKGCEPETQKILDFIYPEEGNKIYIPLEITGERGNVIFKATHSTSGMKLFWHLDDQFLATTEKIHQLSINPRPGKHRITIIDEIGNSTFRNFEIIQH